MFGGGFAGWPKDEHKPFSCTGAYPTTRGSSWQGPKGVSTNRGQKLNPNSFFSNFSGASGISRQNPGISRQKSLIPWVSRDIPNFLAPTPSRGRPPPHQKISRLKSLGLGSFFVPEQRDFHDQGDFCKFLLETTVENMKCAKLGEI